MYVFFSSFLYISTFYGSKVGCTHNCQRTPQSTSHYSRLRRQSPIRPSTQTAEPPPATRDLTVVRPTCQDYVSDLHVRTTCPTYVSGLRVRPTCQDYVSDLRVRTMCPTYVSGLRVRPTCQDYVSDLRVRTTCPTYVSGLCVRPTSGLRGRPTYPPYVSNCWTTLLF